MRAVLSSLFVCLLAAGCEGVAHVDLHYTPDGSVGDGGTDASTDAGSLTVEDGSTNDDGGGPCGCDLRAGLGCCIQKGNAFCTRADLACTNAGGVFLGCLNSTSENECCWNGALGAGSSTHFASACGARPRACAGTADCLSGTCQTATCGSITTGACGVAPVCP